jgi:hypothetical protein
VAARVFNANEFEHVEIVDDYASSKDKGDPCVECLHCQLQFVGQATRIRAHLAGTSGFGVAACSASCGQSRIPQHNKTLHWLCGRMPA